MKSKLAKSAKEILFDCLEEMDKWVQRQMVQRHFGNDRLGDQILPTHIQSIVVAQLVEL